MAKKVTKLTPGRGGRQARVAPRQPPTVRPKPVFGPEPSEAAVAGASTTTAPTKVSSSLSKESSAQQPASTGPRRPALRPSLGAAIDRPMTGRLREGPRLFADYGYVRRDLFRIAVLAISMFVLLLVLSFVIPMWMK